MTTPKTGNNITLKVPKTAIDVGSEITIGKDKYEVVSLSFGSKTDYHELVLEKKK